MTHQRTLRRGHWPGVASRGPTGGRCRGHPHLVIVTAIQQFRWAVCYRGAARSPFGSAHLPAPAFLPTAPALAGAAAISVCSRSAASLPWTDRRSICALIAEFRITGRRRGRSMGVRPSAGEVRARPVPKHHRRIAVTACSRCSIASASRPAIVLPRIRNVSKLPASPAPHCRQHSGVGVLHVQMHIAQVDPAVSPLT